MQLHDKRDVRGLRYALVTVLVYVVLAKLSGESFVLGPLAGLWAGLGTSLRRAGVGSRKCIQVKAALDTSLQKPCQLETALRVQTLDNHSRNRANRAR